jgi:hypothetical protein
MTKIPDFDEETRIHVVSGTLRDKIEEQGTIRLEELAKERGKPPRELYEPLMELVDAGEVAVFPVGEKVQIRWDS